MNLTPAHVRPVQLTSPAIYAGWICPAHLGAYYRKLGVWVQGHLNDPHYSEAVRHLMRGRNWWVRGVPPAPRRPIRLDAPLSWSPPRRASRVDPWFRVPFDPA